MVELHVGDDQRLRLVVQKLGFTIEIGGVVLVALDDEPWPLADREAAVEIERHAFAYVFEGSGTFRDSSDPFGVLTEKEGPYGEEVLIRETTGNRSLVMFDRGDEIVVQAGDEGIRFLLVSGKPIKEPVSWYGPIVMNTQAELQQAVRDLQTGAFIR